MKEIVAQFNGIVLSPHAEEDLDSLRSEFRANQLVACRVTRISKDLEPSVEQNRLLHAVFRLVSENSENQQHRTPALAKLACKIGIDFRDSSVVFVRPDGGVQLQYRSFSFKELKGKERLTVIDQAFEWCAGVLGLSVDEVVAEAKKRMRRNG